MQRLLERRRIAFTGSGADASAAAFDKGRAKEVVAGRVHLAESRIVRTPEELRRGLREMLMRHEQIVLKPLAGGSSRGLFFLDRDGDADAVTASVIANGVPYVVEEFLRGRELTVGVIERPSGECVALPVIEIEVDPGFTFDYAGKYHGSGTREICPARIPDALRDEAQRTAIAAHEALGCRGYSRSDLIAAESGVVFLELNTLPGLTTSSLVPQQLVAAGMTMQQFVEEQITLAMRRARDESRRELAS